MAKQREQARAAGKFKVAQGREYAGDATTFHGYERARPRRRQGRRDLRRRQRRDARRAAGDDAVVVLDRTNFYAEQGGQVGDTGELRNATARMLVEDTARSAAVFGHVGRVVEGEIEVGDTLTREGRQRAPRDTMRNHTATHLLNWALREVLGDHVEQKGSLVDAEQDALRLHPRRAADRRADPAGRAARQRRDPGQPRDPGARDAAGRGAKARRAVLFGEKYGDQVRVLDIGSSRELCGGTHVSAPATSACSRSSPRAASPPASAASRRSPATNALAYLQSLEGTVQRLAGALRAAPAEVPARLGQVLEHVRSLEKELAALKGRLASSQGGDLAAQAIDVKGLKVLAARLDGADAKALRDTLDKLKDKLKTAVVVLAAVDGARVQIAAGVTADSTARVKAGELVNFVAQQVGGKGGGKADMAMAGGSDPSRLGEALASVQGWVAERL